MEKVFFISFALIMFFTSCTNKENYTNIITTGRSAEDEYEMSDIEREKNIKNIICNIDGVNNAWVIAAGDNVVIGIETDLKESEDINRIKNFSVIETKENDKWANNVAVTTNVKIVEMIKNIQ